MRRSLVTTTILCAVAIAGGHDARASETAPRVESTVPGLVFTRLDNLPQAPASARARDSCDPILTKLTTQAGRLAAAAGWGVTSEERIGRYQAVSFAGAFKPGTSGSCALSQGNVAIFDGPQLLAVAYLAPTSTRGIGRLVPLEPDGLRIWDGDFLQQPMADLRLRENDTLAIVPVASEESLCGGKAIVPNIYGMPITRARRVLAERHWTPVPQRAEGMRESELAREGIREVVSCSGTGFGFCGFEYKGAGGQLSVGTVGDVPQVSSYSMRCTGAAATRR